MSSRADSGMRVLVTGARGRLGAALCRQYAERHRVLTLSRVDVDLARPAALRDAISRLEFDVLINTAALTAVDDCERRSELAYDINAHAAGLMAAICADKGARMIQVSTDFVFDGESTAPYSETDPTNPINVYGQSKLLGEAKVMSALDDCLVARVSWVFGPDKSGFPEWLIEQVRTRREVGVPSDKVACPTYSLDFAGMLEPFLRDSLPEDGLLHLCNAGAVSYFDYARHIVETLREMGQELTVRQLMPTRSAGVREFVAPRPLRTAMSTDRFEAMSGGRAPDWRAAIRRHLDELVR